MEVENFNLLLIVNDAAFDQRVREMLGQAWGMTARVKTCASLESGLAELAQHKFDLVIMDVLMADGAGLANIKRTQDLAPRVPIIIIGDIDDQTVALEAVHEGAQDYLVKEQLNPQLLGRAIRYGIERQASEAALLEAEQKYRGIFEHIVEGIFQTTPDGRYLGANPALARIYGYNSPEELMREITDIGGRLYVDPERRTEFIQIMKENDTVTDFESQIYRKDGSVIWIAENVRAIRNAKDELVFYEGTVEDITQRKFAEDQLLESEALYHSLVETLPQNIFRKDKEGHFTFVNHRFCETLGKVATEILGKTDADFFPAEMAAKYHADDLRVMETGQNLEAIEENQSPGGDKIYVQVVKTPLKDFQGAVCGLQGIFWDITERKRTEEAIRKATEELARSREALRVKNEEMEADLKMASEIQQNLLPQQYPTFPRCVSADASNLHFTHRYLPTGSVGGDYFSVTALSDTEVAVFICDVMGHGVRSALVAAMVRALAEEMKMFAGDPGRMLTQLNRDLCNILKHTETDSRTLTTAFYLVADIGAGQMRYANAGHPKPLLVHRASARAQSLAGGVGRSKPALGLFDDAAYTTVEAPIAAGDLVVFFTDGLYEVEGLDQQIYTHEMLVQAVQKRAKLPPAQMFDELLAEIKEFGLGKEFADDVCLVGMDVIKLAGQSGA